MQVGDFFDERYIVEGILGKGGMGTVYLARNINTDTYWAIKEINMMADMQINLAAEPNLLKKLRHPALPRLFDIIEEDGYLYMISDFIEGVSLDKKLAEEGRFEEEIVVDWAIQLCKALDYLHSIKPNPIIYRDIKPSNIILTEKGKLMLIDFGTAREYKPQSDADTVYIGTRGYAAPEQFGTGQTSAVSDIYSFGVTLHHLLTGKSPVVAPYKLRPIRYYNQQLSADLEAIIDKCTCETMTERYQSVSELMAELIEFQGHCLVGRGNNWGEYSRDTFVNRRVGEERMGDDTGQVGYGCDGKSDICTGNREIAGVSGLTNEGNGVDGRMKSAIGKKKVKTRRCNVANSNNTNSNNTKRAFEQGANPKRSFKRLVIAVWDNAEFGCELAYTAAKYTGSEVLLADIDLLAPKSDIILNTGRYPVKGNESEILGHSGLDMVMDAINRGILSSALLKQAAIVKKEMKNLYIITGNFRLENYEYYSEDSLPQLIEKCYRSFDITVLLVNRSIYDAFTLSALLKSDINIAAVRGNVTCLREFNSYIAFLNDKQHLPLENTRFVLFEHDKGSDMSEAEVRQATQDNLIGRISPSGKRAMYRNLNGAYSFHMEKEILNEYYSIHEKLGLVPAIGPLQKAIQLFTDIFTASKSKKDITQEG